MVYFGKEKRKFARVRSHHLLKYNIAGQTQKVLSYGKDISAGGVLFHAKEELTPETMIEVEIVFPLNVRPVMLKARVVRIKQLKEMEGYEIGAEFTDIDEDSRKFIKSNI